VGVGRVGNPDGSAWSSDCAGTLVVGVTLELVYLLATDEPWVSVAQVGKLADLYRVTLGVRNPARSYRRRGLDR